MDTTPHSSPDSHHQHQHAMNSPMTMNMDQNQTPTSSMVNNLAPNNPRLSNGPSPTQQHLPSTLPHPQGPQYHQMQPGPHGPPQGHHPIVQHMQHPGANGPMSGHPGGYPPHGYPMPPQGYHGPPHQMPPGYHPGMHPGMMPQRGNFVFVEINILGMVPPHMAPAYGPNGYSGGPPARHQFGSAMVRHRPPFGPQNGPMTPMRLGEQPQPLAQNGQPMQNPGTMSKVQMWHQTHFADSGVQSMSHSTAPSMISMSSIHAASQMSTVSSLPDEFQNRLELTEQQKARFEHIPSNFHGGDMENAVENARKALPELIPLLDDKEEEVVFRALEMVQHISKLENSIPAEFNERIIREKSVPLALKNVLKAHRNNKKIVRYSLSILFHISNRPSGLELIIEVIRENGIEFFNELLPTIGIHELSCHKYTLMLLHNLMSERNVGKQVIEHVRELKALSLIADWLNEEKNEKLLAIIVDIIQLLCDKNSEQKAFFISLNGPHKLKHLLANANYENLLGRTARLLRSISTYDPQKVVDAGAFEVLHIHLDHASQKLVYDLLYCIRDLCDVPTTKINIAPLLKKLVQLLGTSDMTIKHLCTQILSNLCANNQANKEFLHQNDTVRALVQVLCETHRLSMERQGSQVLEDIQERALATLRHLCVGHSFANDVQKQIVQYPAGEILLEKLVEMRPAILRQTLFVICKAVLQESNLPRFREIRVPRGPHHVSYVQQLVYLLHVACSTYQTTKTIEEVSVSDLIQYSLATLQQLCRDRVMLKQIYDCLMEVPILENSMNVLLPLFVLKQNDDKLKMSALGLVSELVLIPEVAQILASDMNFVESLKNCGRQKNPPFSNFANLTLERLESGGDPRVLDNFLTQLPATPSSGYGSGAHSSYGVTPTRPGYHILHGYPPSGPPGGMSYNCDQNQSMRYPMPHQASGQCTPAEMVVQSPHSIHPPPGYPMTPHSVQLPPLNTSNRPQNQGQVLPPDLRLPHPGSPGENMAESSGEVTPRNEDLAYGAVEDNPFVNVFCSEPSSTSDPLKINTNPYPHGGLHDIDPSLVMPVGAFPEELQMDTHHQQQHFTPWNPT